MIILTILRLLFAPSFNSFGEINECVGCRGCEREERADCKYNPRYWNGYDYIGPSRRELRKLRKQYYE